MASESTPAAVVDQFYPLELNPITNEPFLRLQKHKNIIITPMRQDDADYDAYVRLLNDSRIYENLMGPPFPYTLQDAKDWVAMCKPELDEIVQRLREAAAAKLSTPIIVSGCPVTSIREVKEDGSDVFIGSVDIVRCIQGELLDTDTVDWEGKAQKEKANREREVGDPEIVWGFGDYLDPAYHSKGIMTDAVATVLHSWAVPRMNVRKVMVSAFTGNEGSVKVFEKNGFKLLRKMDEYREVKGRMRGVYVLEWELVSQA